MSKLSRTLLYILVSLTSAEAQSPSPEWTLKVDDGGVYDVPDKFYSSKKNNATLSISQSLGSNISIFFKETVTTIDGYADGFRINIRSQSGPIKQGVYSNTIGYIEPGTALSDLLIVDAAPTTRDCKVLPGSLDVKYIQLTESSIIGLKIDGQTSCANKPDKVMKFSFGYNWAGDTETLETSGLRARASSQASKEFSARNVLAYPNEWRSNPKNPNASIAVTLPRNKLFSRAEVIFSGFDGLPASIRSSVSGDRRFSFVSDDYNPIVSGSSFTTDILYDLDLSNGITVKGNSLRLDLKKPNNIVAPSPAAASHAIKQIKIYTKPDYAPWKNQVTACDVNDDGVVAPLDVLIIINYLKKNPRLTFPSFRPVGQPFYDVNGDGKLSESDPKAVTNCLNRRTQ